MQLHWALLLVLLPYSGASLLGGLTGSSGWDDFGPKCQSFLTKGVSMLSKVFSPEDKIICDIGGDLVTCIAQNNSMDFCIKLLGNHSNAYIATLSSTKSNLLGDLLTFQGCLSDCKDSTLTTFLGKTVAVALKAKLKVPFKEKFSPKVRKMVANNKSEQERVEEMCYIAECSLTPSLLKQIIKKAMMLIYSQTWTDCFVNHVIAKGILTIGKYTEPNFKTKKTAPSG